MLERYFAADEGTKEQYMQQLWRPNYHFTAAENWINDPNGLVYFKGFYHMFYQHNPLSCEWGPMHWGHAVSKDMVHWRHLPMALYPDEKYDAHEKGGCFSGSAVVHEDKLYIFYTGAVQVNGKVSQTQCLVTSVDGINFKKYEANPVISEYPKHCGSEEFRDPKVIQYGDKWYMVVGTSLGKIETGGDGRILLYVSEDLYNWRFCKAIFESCGEFGTMCECPDFFPLQDKWILTFSPMYHPQMKKAIYCVGSMDFDTFEYKIEYMGDIDVGFDYYAPQTFEDAEGRRICIAWQNGWLWMPWCEDFGPTAAEHWQGCMSVPRKISLTENNRLRFEPVDEMEKLYELANEMQNVRISTEKKHFTIKNPTSFRIKLEADARKITSRAFEIGLRGKENRAALVQVDLLNNLITFDRNNADRYVKGRVSCPFDSENGKFSMEILVDKSSVEIYVNDGLQCITSNIYPEREQVECWIRTPYKEATIDRISTCCIKPIWE